MTEPMKTKVTKVPAQGRFLIARPFLQDPNFWRSVVLLTEHNEEGTVGFVLNRPIEYGLNDLIEDFPTFNAPVFLGGPVGTDSLHYLHQVPDLEGSENREIAPGVYWGSSFEALRAGILAGMLTPENVRLFVGYSGWGPHQLEGELKMKSWYVSGSNNAFTFSDTPQDLWREVLRSMGERYRLISHYPEDPSMN